MHVLRPACDLRQRREGLLRDHLPGAVLRRAHQGRAQQHVRLEGATARRAPPALPSADNVTPPHSGTSTAGSPRALHPDSVPQRGRCSVGRSIYIRTNRPRARAVAQRCCCFGAPCYESAGTVLLDSLTMKSAVQFTKSWNGAMDEYKAKFPHLDGQLVRPPR